MPNIRAGCLIGTGKLGNCSKSIPLLTTESRAGTKKLRNERALSAAERLLQIWLEGHRALNLPKTEPHSLTARKKSLRMEPIGIDWVPRAAQWTAKLV